MESSGCAPNGYSYSIVMATCWEEGKVREAEELWEEMKVKGLCKSGEIVRAEELFKEMGLNGIKPAMSMYKDMCRKDFRPPRLTFELLIRGLCDEGMVVKAFEITKAMREFGVCPTGTSYEISIKGLCAERKTEEALKLQAEMMGKGFKPNPEIYDAFVDYLGQGYEQMVTMLRKEALETEKEHEEN